MSEISMLAIDLAKRSFQVCAVESSGSIIFNRAVSRPKLMELLADLLRDRAGTFDPQLIAKYQSRFPGFDEKIISMYARGMTVREIQGHLEDLYGVDASPALISRITDTVMDAVKEWRAHPLDACYVPATLGQG